MEAVARNIHLTNSILGFEVIEDYRKFLPPLELDFNGIYSTVINGAAFDERLNGQLIESNSYSNGYLKKLYSQDNESNELYTLEDMHSFKKLISYYFNLYLKRRNLDTNLDYQFESVWLIVQRENDYGPIHTHFPNDYAGIIYLQSPSTINSNTFPNGIMTIVEENTNYNVPPIPGTIYFWPGHLLHAVYPFQGKGERIAISFNIYIKP